MKNNPSFLFFFLFHSFFSFFFPQEVFNKEKKSCGLSRVENSPSFKIPSAVIANAKESLKIGDYFQTVGKWNYFISGGLVHPSWAVVQSGQA